MDATPRMGAERNGVFDHEADGPIDLADLLAKRGAVLKSEAPTIVDRLTKRFGLGQRPDVRKSLYLKVQKWVREREEERMAELSRVVMQAVSARNPGRYFAATILRVMGQASMGGAEW